MNIVVNSFPTWKALTEEALHSIETLEQCEYLRKMVKNTDLKQFPDEDAELWRNYILDKVAALYKNIREKEAWLAESEPDEAKIMSIMANFLEAGGDVSQLNETTDPSVLEVESDYMKVMSFTNKLLFPNLNISSKGQELYHGMMAELGEVATKYIEQFKNL